MAIPAPGGRLPELDGLRGLCAATVVLGHFAISRPNFWDAVSERQAPGLADPAFWLFRTPLSLTVSASEAVLVFFVLSGFVLALTLEKVDRWRYGPYAIKRLARVWLPFAAAILISAAAAFVLWSRPVPGVSAWFRMSWGEAPTPGLILDHLTMRGDAMGLDNVMWSLVHEVRISLVFPLIAWGVATRPRATLAATVALSLAAALTKDRMPAYALATLADSAQYIYLFALGALLYTRLDALRAVFRSWTAKRLAALWVGVLALVFLGLQAIIFGLDPVGVLFANGLTAAAIVGLCLVAPPRILATAPALFLGRVSYSLYLIHMPLMLIVLHLGGATGQEDALRFCGLALALPAAFVFHRLVEQPANGLGRALAARFATGSAKPASAGATALQEKW